MAGNIVTLKAYLDELWNQHDLGAIDRYCVVSGSQIEVRSMGVAQFEMVEDTKNRLNEILTRFPSHKLELLESVEEGDSIQFMWKGSYYSIEKQNRVYYSGISIYGFKDGLISSRRGVSLLDSIQSQKTGKPVIASLLLPF